MKVLYAHTRNEIIINFRFNPSFNLLDEFSRYFNLYWAWRFIQPDVDYSELQLAGHPSGHLQQLVFLGHYCGGFTNEQALFLSRLWSSNQGWLGMQLYPMYELRPTILSTYREGPNWSTTDIDAPRAHYLYQRWYDPVCICATYSTNSSPCCSDVD